MTIQEASKRCLEIQQKYRAINKADGHKEWGASDYLMGMMKDVGDLAKLIMAKNNLRNVEGDVDELIEHEIVDCFWSLFVIADQLGIDIESAINKQLDELNRRLA